MTVTVNGMKTKRVARLARRRAEFAAMSARTGVLSGETSIQPGEFVVITGKYNRYFTDNFTSEPEIAIRRSFIATATMCALMPISVDLPDIFILVYYQCGGVTRQFHLQLSPNIQVERRKRSRGDGGPFTAEHWRSSAEAVGPI